MATSDNHNFNEHGGGGGGSGSNNDRRGLLTPTQSFGHKTLAHSLRDQIWCISCLQNARHIKHVIFDISREKILSLGDHGEGGFELEGLGLANAGLAGQEDCAVGDFVVLDHLEDHASGLVGDD
ncbi:hypothetical protein HKD37_06G016930 [Glycine soja]